MADPVTLCTGITYDRESIEKWLFSSRKNTCPATKQTLTDTSLVPNHTLRRMIQQWCAANAADGVARIPTPRAPVDKELIVRLLEDDCKPQSLRKLREIVMESDRNRRCAEEAGVAEFLMSVMRNYIQHRSKEDSTACEEAMSLFHHLKVSEEGIRNLVAKNTNLIETMTSMLQHTNIQSRAYALFSLRSIFEAISPVRLVTLNDDIFTYIVRILRDQISFQTTKTALRILHELSQWGRNRNRFADADAVSALVELLLEAPETRLCEMMMVVLDRLCGCAEGRQELLRHAAGVAVVSKNVVGVSNVASERAVRILHRLSKFSATMGFLKEMLHVGAVAKLCLVLELDDGIKTREKAAEILRMHERILRNSPCFPPSFKASYPSSSSSSSLLKF